MSQTFAQILESVPNTTTRKALWMLFELILSGTHGTQQLGPTKKGEGHFGASTIQFDTTFVDGNAEGRLQWNSDDGTLEVGMPGSTVNLQIGQEFLVRVKNDSGADLTNGTPLYITGSQGTRPTVDMADASSILTASVSGVSTEAIDDNHFGYMTVRGLVRGVNTNHLTEGGPVYVSPTAGEIVKTAPTPPDITTIVGICIYKHASEGIILADPVIMQMVQYLSDVYGTPSNGDTIRWNDTNSRFEFGA